MSEEVRNWLPGEPGKYVTMLDLKERWMKQQEEKKRAEKEREAREKAGERLDELKIDGDKERVEAKRLAGDRRKSDGGGRVKNRGRIESGGLKVEAVVEDIRYGDVEFGAGETSKTGAVVKVEERKISGGKQVDGLNSWIDDRRRSGRRGRVKNCGRIESSGSKVEAVVEDIKYGDVEFGAGETSKMRAVVKVEERKNSGGKQVDGLNSRIDDRRRSGRREWTGCSGGDLPRVSKEAELGDRKVLLESKSGDFKYEKKELQLDDVKISGDVQVANHNPKYAGLGRKTKGNDLHVKARTSKFTENGNVLDEKKGVEQIEEVSSKGGDQVTKMNCPYHSRSEHEGSGGFWVCNFVQPVSGAEKGESAMSRDNGKMINESNTSLNYDVKLQSQTVGPSVDIEEHFKTSAITKNGSNRSDKFKSQGPYTDRKMYGDSRFKAPRNIGSLTTKHSNFKHTVVKAVDFASDGFDDKSIAAEVTESENTSGTTFRTRGNGIDERKTHQNSRFNSERNFSNRKPKTFNGRMQMDRLEKSKFVWVKKGEASVDSVRGEERRGFCRQCEG